MLCFEARDFMLRIEREEGLGVRVWVEGKVVVDEGRSRDGKGECWILFVVGVSFVGGVG